MYTIESGKGIINKFASLVEKVIDKKGMFNLAISGGRTPVPFFEALGELFSSNAQWKAMALHTRIFWVDERPVAEADPASNVGSALSKLQDTGLHFFKPSGNAADLSKEAERYEVEIRSVISEETNGIPRFDLVLLGVGDDGHIASLFPGTEGMQENDKLYIANKVDALQQTRLSMTYPLLLHATEIWVLFAGKKKQEFIEKIMRDENSRLPINILEKQYQQLQFVEVVL
jgi:6-phosphogluconolactonase